MEVRLLIADPDEEWLNNAKEHFASSYQVKTALSGKEAQTSLYEEEFALVVLSVDLKNYAASQVLAFIKTHHPRIKTIMTIEEKKDKDVIIEKFKKLGVDDVLEKPFEMDKLKEILEKNHSLESILGTVRTREELGPEEECELSDDKFTRIKISEFYSSKQVLFDIFIKLKDHRYTKILHTGDTLCKDRIDKYKKDKEVDYLYFLKDDLDKYIKFNSFFTKKVVSSKVIRSAKKVKLLQNVSEKFLEHSFEEGIKPQVLEQGKELAENMYMLIQDNQELFGLLRQYQDFDPNAYTHAYLVSLFSTSIVRQFEWHSKTILECTALACFFHDIGKVKLPKDLLNLKVKDMNDDQFEDYKRHPELGFAMLENNSLVNNSVKQTILQHHEHFDGSGFPFAKRGSKILTISNTVCLADNFVHIIQEEDQKPVDALKTLLSRREQLPWYHSLLVENLIKIFMDPEQKKKEDKKVKIASKRSF